MVESKKSWHGARVIMMILLGASMAGRYLGADPSAFGISSRAMSLGNATTAGGDPATAAFSNPAALIHDDKVHLSVNILMTDFRLKNANKGAKAGPSQLEPDSYENSDAEH